MEIIDFYDPPTVEDYDFVAPPTTVEDIFQDYRGRRSGLLLALTTGSDSLCFLCSAGINNFCLYGLPNGKWQVRHPPNELDLPQPVCGIKYVENGIEHRQGWLALIAKQSDSWLISLSFYLASHLSCNERNLLFNLINNLPSLYKVVTGEEADDPEMSIVFYKAGESRMQEELVKLWEEHKSEKKSASLEVWIPVEYVTATNPQVKGRQLWGTDIYTDDSDVVAVLMHTGYCRPIAPPFPPTMHGLCATIRVLPPQYCYTSKLRNNVWSQPWGPGSQCSYRVESCYILKKDGGSGTIEVKPYLTGTVEPTIAPMALQRPEAKMQYNLLNEPWMKYSISVVADKGLEKHLFTSARLKNGEVLYLETHSRRYELCFAGEKTIKASQASQQQSSQNHLTNGDKTDDTIIDVFRWSLCKKPLPQKRMQSIGFPLPPEHVEVLEEDLDWEDIQWSETGVWIAGKEYTLARVHFLSPK